jgi:hypothetical protein
VLNGRCSIPAGGFGVSLKVDATLDWGARQFYVTKGWRLLQISGLVCLIVVHEGLGA